MRLRTAHRNKRSAAKRQKLRSERLKKIGWREWLKMLDLGTLAEHHVFLAQATIVGSIFDRLMNPRGAPFNLRTPIALPRVSGFEFLALPKFDRVEFRPKYYVIVDDVDEN